MTLWKVGPASSHRGDMSLSAAGTLASQGGGAYEVRRARKTRALRLVSAASTVLAALAVIAPVAAQANSQSRRHFVSGLTVINPVPQLTAGNFASPGPETRPWARWTIAPGSSTTELQSELGQMAAAGISGAELGQGYFPPTSQLAALYKTANALGITLSLAHGPVGEPADFSINNDNARKQLMYADTTVSGGQTFSGALPAPITSNRATLVAVSAYQCAGTCPTSGAVTLDQSSYVDLTALVTGQNTSGINGGTTAGNINWTAPSGGDWMLLTFWNVGYIAQPDLLSKAGFELETSIMNNAFSPIRGLMRQNGGDFFFDSHTSDRGSPDDSWTNDMASDFRRANGYSIMPYLPLIEYQPVVGFGAPSPAFQFESAVNSAKFRDDLNQTRTDLWIDNQILPLEKWAKANYNYDIRLQPYGQNDASIDEIQASAVLQKPETETLWFGDSVDSYLPIASANHMDGNTWYSCECSAVLTEGYGETWQDQVIHVNRAFAGGVTQIVYHTYPSDSGTTSTWPGYSLFPTGAFSNNWGPRNPNWIDAKSYNDYFARNQLVLRQGEDKTDVAVYMQNYTWPQPYQSNPSLLYWADPGLQEAGYTRDYLDQTLMDRPNAVVRDGRLAPDGPDYKAFIYDDQQPTITVSRTAMPVSVAEKILSYAQAGLPIIVIGQLPSEVPGVNPAGDSELQSVVAQIMQQPTVHTVESEAAVPAELESLGIEPDAKPASPGPVLSVHRQTANADYYWLYNEGTITPAGEPATSFDPDSASAVDTTFTLAGRGRPYLLDTWTGQITPIADYQSTSAGVTVNVSHPPDGSEVIALVRGDGSWSPPNDEGDRRDDPGHSRGVDDGQCRRIHGGRPARDPGDSTWDVSDPAQQRSHGHEPRWDDPRSDRPDGSRLAPQRPGLAAVESLRNDIRRCCTSDNQDNHQSPTHHAGAMDTAPRCREFVWYRVIHNDA